MRGINFKINECSTILDKCKELRRQKEMSRRAANKLQIGNRKNYIYKIRFYVNSAIQEFEQTETSNLQRVVHVTTKLAQIRTIYMKICANGDRQSSNRVSN
ncbi:hypothetical protein CBL_09003 [Carabus blaptoides fortunei]